MESVYLVYSFNFGKIVQLIFRFFFDIQLTLNPFTVVSVYIQPSVVHDFPT